MKEPNPLAAFPITQKWPSLYPDRIQLYSWPTPNGVKISIALEELGLAYEAHPVTLSDTDVKSPEFLSLSPNNKIPALIDPDGPEGKPIALFESGAILVYLAEKAGKLIGASPAERYIIIQWLMFQMGGIGPMFGQLGYFVRFAGSSIEDPRPRTRYINEAKRLLAVLEGQFQTKDWIVGDYSIADIAIAPWLRPLVGTYDAADLVEFSTFPRVNAYLERFLARPAVQKGLDIPPRS